MRRSAGNSPFVGTFRTCRDGLTMSVVRRIVLQNSKNSFQRFFRGRIGNLSAGIRPPIA
jgi:hypothetical protein